MASRGLTSSRHRVQEDGVLPAHGKFKGLYELIVLKNGRKRNILLILAFSLLAMATMGYHPGMEDDGVYLTAIKSDLNPALYPHDAPFFRVQLQATLFDKWVADFILFTHLSVSVT